MEFELSIPFLSNECQLSFRLVSRQCKEQLDNFFKPTLKGLSFLEKKRSIAKKNWISSEGKRFPICLKEFSPNKNFQLWWDQPLAPLCPKSTWPMFLKYIPSFFVSTFILKWFKHHSYPLFDENKKQIWEIRLKIHLKKIKLKEDWVGIGFSTQQRDSSFVGLSPHSIGYHIDDGLICYDSSIYFRTKSSKGMLIPKNIQLSLDYRDGSWEILEDDVSVYKNFLYGDFLTKPLFLVVSGSLDSICFLDVNISY